MDLSDSITLLKLLDQYNPSEIYHLAGDSFVADSYNNPKSSLLNNIEHTINLLEAIRYRNSNCWCFIPSSSEIFAGTEKDILNEPAHWIWSHKRWKKRKPKDLEILKNEHENTFNTRFRSH